MTATKELTAIEKARKLGVEDYITKPFMPQILLETVYGALNWEGCTFCKMTKLYMTLYGELTLDKPSGINRKRKSS